MDPANEITGGRAKDILWELIPFMPKPTLDFYGEALFRCKTHSQLDKALGGLKGKSACALLCLAGNLETQSETPRPNVGGEMEEKHANDVFPKYDETHLDHSGVTGVKSFSDSFILMSAL